MKGEVLLRIRGLMPEKLIERAREHGVTFQSIAPQGDHEIVVGVNARDAEKLTALCHRFSIPCQVLSRRGKSALVPALRRRWTLLVGILLALGFCWAFLGHIWRVDIRFTGDAAALGNVEEISSILHELGVKPGVSRDIDAKLLSEELLARAEDFSYVGARVEGVRLLIEAAPEAASPEVYDLDAARDLYADRSGIVVSVNVESGVPCVQPGDAVRRGQLLIRGEEKISKEETRGIAALGEVVVRAWFEGSAEGPLWTERAAYTGKVSSASTLVTPWFEIPIVTGEEFDSQTVQADALPIGGLYLPVCIERVNNRETRVAREAVDVEALSERLGALAMADARSRLCAEGPAQYEIARCWTRVEPDTGDVLRVSAVCEIYANTAVTPEALRQGG